MKMLFKSPKLWWRFEGRYYHKDFIRGVKNLWRWLPIVWKDKDWDPTHIYKILQFKLEQQAYAIGSRDRHTGAKRDAELMLLCAISIASSSLYLDLYGFSFIASLY